MKTILLIYMDTRLYNGKSVQCYHNTENSVASNWSYEDQVLTIDGWRTYYKVEFNINRRILLLTYEEDGVRKIDQITKL